MKQTVASELTTELRERWRALPEGTPLPGERELALDCGVSRPTLRKAIAVLRRQGLVYSQPGKGLFRGVAGTADPDRIRGCTIARSLTDISVFNVEMVKAVVDSAGTHGVNVLSRVTTRAVDDEKTYLQGLSEQPKLRGLLVNPPFVREDLAALLPEYRRLQSLGVHVIAVNVPGLELPIDHVWFDDCEGMAMMTRYLLELGHERICHVAVAAPHIRREIRVRGFEEGLQGTDLAPADYILDAALADGRFLGPHPAEWVRDGGVTAFLCHNEDVGALVWAALAAEGLAVPDNVSVAAYDHIPHVDRGAPGEFTSAIRDRALLGRSAFALLLERLREGPPSRHRACEVVLPVELKPGASVVPREA